MKDRLWLLLDQGGHAGRARVVNDRGNTIAQAERAVATHRNGVFVEQDPQELLASLTDSIAEVHAKIGADAGRIEAAGLVTQRSSVVCWNRETGEKLSAAISWQDRRGAKFLDDVSLDEDRIRELTGMRPSPHYGASKLAWCRENLPDVQHALRAGKLCWGPLASFLLYGLLEENPYLVDATNAQRSLLWSFENDWSPELCGAFGIPGDSLPDCTGNRHEFGHLLLGTRRIPLRVCAGDQNLVPLAFDIHEGVVAVNAGTGAFLLSPCARFPEADKALLNTLLWQDESAAWFAEEGTVNGAGSALSWLADNDARDIPWNRLDDILDSVGELPLFLNGVGGLGSPWWRYEFDSRFIGAGDADARLAAVIESIVFLVQANLDRIPASAVIMTGGLSRSTGLCRRIAALSGLPLRRSLESEASLFGLARRLATHIPALRTETVAPLEAETAEGLRLRYREFLSRMR